METPDPIWSSAFAPQAASLVATRYDVSVLPEGHIDYDAFIVTVQYRGRDFWAVVRHDRLELSDTLGTWDWPTGDDRCDENYLADHRFPFGRAVFLARTAVVNVRVNGFTALDVLREETDEA